MRGFLKSWASRYQSVWNNKPYIYLLAVAFLSLSGDLIASVATTWTLTTKTENPAFFLTASIFATQTAFVLASPIMGNVVDRFGPLRSLIGATVARAFIIALLAFCVTRIDEGLSPWILVALLGADYAISPISRTGEFVLIQMLVPEEDMMAANALQGIQYDLGFIVGPILGGLFAEIGVVIGLLVNIASFVAYGLVVVWLIRQGKTTLLRKDEGEKTSEEETAGTEKPIGFWASFREGISFIGSTPPLPWVIAIGFLWNVLLFGPLGVINPILAKELLSGSALGFGLLTAANAAGFTLGLVIIGGVDWKWSMAVTCAVVVATQGLLYVLVGLAPGVVLTILFLFVGGLITAPTDVFFKRIRQKLVPVTMQGRVTSVSSSLGFIGSPFGALLAGTLLQTYGNPAVGLVLMGCGFLLFLTVGFIATRRSMRAL